MTCKNYFLGEQNNFVVEIKYSLEYYLCRFYFYYALPSMTLNNVVLTYMELHLTKTIM
jgi:hypothetical protein